MYIEHETSYDLGQKLFKLNSDNKIEEYEITQIECTHKFNPVSPYGSASTKYLIKGITDPSYCATWFTQNDVTQKFRVSKKQIAQEIVNQL